MVERNSRYEVSPLEKEIGEAERKLNTQTVVVRGFENTIMGRKGSVLRFDMESPRLDADLKVAREKLDRIRAELTQLYARRSK